MLRRPARVRLLDDLVDPFLIEPLVPVVALQDLQETWRLLTPEERIEATPTFIVSTAIATRDFQDVHHDRDLAQRCDRIGQQHEAAAEVDGIVGAAHVVVDRLEPGFDPMLEPACGERAGVVTGALRGHPEAGASGGPDDPGEVQGSFRYSVSPGYIETMRIPLLRGRLFDHAEVLRAAHVALVNEAFVKQYLPDREPIGQFVRSPMLRIEQPSLVTAEAPDDWRQVIGVVADARNDGLDRPPKPASSP